MKQVLIHSSVTILSVVPPLYKLISGKQYFKSVMLLGLATSGLLIQLEQNKEKTIIKPSYRPLLHAVDMILGFINMVINPVNIFVRLLLPWTNCMTLQNKTTHYTANEVLHHLYNILIYFIH